MIIDGATDNQIIAYRQGRTARSNGGLKCPPGHLNWEMQHWWLAGWNDRDIEIDGPETPSKVVRRGKS